MYSVNRFIVCWIKLTSLPEIWVLLSCDSISMCSAGIPSSFVIAQSFQKVALGSNRLFYSIHHLELLFLKLGLEVLLFVLFVSRLVTVLVELLLYFWYFEYFWGFYSKFVGINFIKNFDTYCQIVLQQGKWYELTLPLSSCALPVSWNGLKIVTFFTPVYGRIFFF